MIYDELQITRHHVLLIDRPRAWQLKEIIDNANCFLPATSPKYLAVDVIKLKWHLKYIKQTMDLKEMSYGDCKRFLKLCFVAFFPPNVGEFSESDPFFILRGFISLCC